MLYLGGCHNNFNRNEASISLWINTTKVQDYANTNWSASGIAPYERPLSTRDYNCFGTTTCDNEDCTAITNGYGTGNPSCDLPDSCSFIDCSGGYKMFNGRFWNCFQQTTSSVNLSLCEKIGFKPLITNKIWQGRQSYTSRNLLLPDSFDGGGFDIDGTGAGCVACQVHNYDATADPTHYLTVQGNCSIILTATGDQAPYVISGSANASASVDRYSGVGTYTQSSSSFLASGTNPGGDVLYQTAYQCLSDLIGLANSNASSLVTTAVSLLNTLNGYGEYALTSFTQNNSNKCTWIYDLGGSNTATVVLDMNNFTFNFSTIGPGVEEGGGGSVQSLSNLSIAYTATTATMTQTGLGISQLDNGSVSETITAVLSNPYTSTQLYDDAISLFNNWDLGNDILYPWRFRSTENNVGAPIISYDETDDPVSLGAGPYSDWLFSGAVLGKPNITASTALNWDPRHLNYYDCTDYDIPQDPEGYGAWSGNGGIPTAATQWSTEADMLNIGGDNSFGTPQGMWSWYIDGQLWLGIYAEIYLGTRIAFNLARPCGYSDRLQLQTSASNCIDHIASSSSVVLNSLAIDTIAALSPCTASIYGTGNAQIDGIWIVSDTAGTISLNKLLLSGSDVPVDAYGYATDGSTTFANGQISALRWQSSTPIICGTAAITSITNTSPVTISLAQPLRGVFVGDKVTVGGCTGSSNLNGNSYTIIPLGSPYTHFVLSGSTYSTPYTSSGYIYSQPTSSFPWNSTSPRHTYVVGSIGSNWRQQGEYNRLQSQSASLASSNDCVGNSCVGGPVISSPPTITASYVQSTINLNPCSPGVMAIYPPGYSQSFKNYVTASWPNNIIAGIDDQYQGMIAQAFFIQTMTDPYGLYVTPCPCRPVYTTVSDCNDTLVGYSCNNGVWTWQGDTLCLGVQQPQYDEDCEITTYGADYYAATPVYEAMLNLPAGAPPLIDGANFTSSYFVPNIGGLTYVPWWLWLEQTTEVCNNCTRFDAYLYDNGVYCDNTVIVEEGI